MLPEQFSFREELSDPHQVYELFEHGTTAKMFKSVAAAVFFAIE